MRLVSFLLRYAPRRVTAAVVAGVISGASNTCLLAVFNAALGGQYPRIALIWSFVGLCALLPLSRYVSEMVLAHLSQGALYDLRVRLSRQILAAPLRRLEEFGPHRLMSALADDVPVITNTLVLVPLLCINAAITVGGLIYLGILSFKVLLAVLLFIFVGILTYQLPIARAMRSFGLAREIGDQLFSQFRDLTEGAKELKLHARRREAFLTEVLGPSADSLRRHNLSAMTVYTAAASWGQVLVFIVIGLALFVLPAQTPVGTSTLTGYTLTLLYLMTPLQVIMNALPNLSRANVALKRLDDLGVELMAKGSEEWSGREVPAVGRWARLELKGVTHTYRGEGEGEHFILGPLDLTIVPGELIFIIGGNGSGKTTLAKLLVGLYIPESGEIRLDGSPVTADSLETYRGHFSMVFSDFHLFEALLGMEEIALDEKALEYLVQLRLEQKVAVRDGRFSTTKLSQGQRKRLALLTAYLEGRPIYVFDEWAADQDPVFKHIFYRQLLPELKASGKTALVITHDDRYFDMADRIIKLEYGKVEYDGPASSLGQRPLGDPLPAVAAEPSVY
ncbi:MAG: cyclic peptide export ABC transporter [Pyrinomonadaceae bacterium]